MDGLGGGLGARATRVMRDGREGFTVGIGYAKVMRRLGCV